MNDKVKKGEDELCCFDSWRGKGQAGRRYG